MTVVALRHFVSVQCRMYAAINTAIIIISTWRRLNRTNIYIKINKKKRATHKMKSLSDGLQ